MTDLTTSLNIPPTMVQPMMTLPQTQPIDQRPVFRETSISVNGNNIRMKYKTIEDLFGLSDYTAKTKPFLVIAPGGSGKTVLCNDIIYKCAPYYTNIYYITDTAASTENRNILAIPKVFRYTPTFDNLKSICSEILDQKAATYDVTVERLVAILVKYTSSSQANEILNELKSYVKSNEFIRKYNVTDNAVMVNLQDAYISDVLQKTLILLYQEKGLINKLDAADVAIMNGLVSEPPRTLLIMDDVTSALSQLNSNNAKVVDITVDPPVSVSVKTAYSNLIKWLLTQGRHNHVTAIICLHDLSPLEKNLSGITNLVLMNQGSLSIVKMSRTQIIASIMPKLTEAAKKLFLDGTYKYFFMSTDISVSEGDIEVSVADCHDDYDTTYIYNNLSPLNKHYVDVYNQIASNLEVSNSAPQVNDNIIDNDLNVGDLISAFI